jgi:hypothetical protein
MTETQQVLSALLNSEMEESTKEVLTKLLVREFTDADIERIEKLPITCENCGALMQFKDKEIVCKNQHLDWHYM